MKNKVFYLSLVLIFLAGMVSVFGDSGTTKNKNSSIPNTVLRDGETKIYAWFLQVKPGKLAVITRVPKKSQAKVESINLKSPSGLTYKTNSIQNMPLKDLKKFLSTVHLFESYFRFVCNNLGSLLIKDAYASSCGEGRHSEEEGVNLGPLINLATRGDTGPWVSIALFDVNEEVGNWKVGVKYNNEGRSGQANGNVAYSTGQELSDIDFESLIGGPLIAR